MDLQMPVMDGFDSTQNILEFLNEKDPSQAVNACKIVALTSYTDQKTIDRCMRIGMIDVIHKPLEYDSLKRIILMYHIGLDRDQYNLYI